MAAAGWMRPAAAGCMRPTAVGWFRPAAAVRKGQRQEERVLLVVSGGIGYLSDIL